MTFPLCGGETRCEDEQRRKQRPFGRSFPPSSVQPESQKLWRLLRLPPSKIRSPMEGRHFAFKTRACIYFIKGNRDCYGPKGSGCLIGNACQRRCKTVLRHCRRRLESGDRCAAAKRKCRVCALFEMKNTVYSPLSQMLTSQAHPSPCAGQRDLALSTSSTD